MIAIMTGRGRLYGECNGRRPSASAMHCPLPAAAIGQAAVSRLPQLYDRNGPAASLIRTMLNELVSAPIERLHLPMPGDARLRKIADAMAADPSDRRSIGEWARRVAMSERSLSRLIARETGMTFVCWRQQFPIIVALERLAQHEAVQNIALDLGYESASAFITMLRKTLGPPATTAPTGTPRLRLESVLATVVTQNLKRPAIGARLRRHRLKRRPERAAMCRASDRSWLTQSASCCRFAKHF